MDADQQQVGMAIRAPDGAKNGTEIPNQILRKQILNITFPCSFITKVRDAAENFLLRNDHNAS